MVTIDQSVTVHASPQKVFQALTVADELVRWFPTRASSDPRVGGKLDLAWDFDDASQNGTQQATYQAVKPNEMVRYSWAAGHAYIPTTVTFTLTSSNGDTAVRVLHEGFPDGAEGASLVEMHNGPWIFYLQNLKSYLEQGTDARSQVIKQKTM